MCLGSLGESLKLLLLGPIGYSASKVVGGSSKTDDPSSPWFYLKYLVIAIIVIIIIYLIYRWFFKKK